MFILILMYSFSQGNVVLSLANRPQRITCVELSVTEISGSALHNESSTKYI